VVDVRTAIPIATVLVLCVSACASRGAYPIMTAVTWGYGVCDTIPNSYRCATTIERDRLAAGAGVVAGTADSICFSGEGWTGCLPRMVGDSNYPGTAVYIGTMANPPYHVLWVQYYEGNHVRLVHVRTGRRVELDDYPVPSPSGERLAVAAGDLEAHYGPNRLTVWRQDGDSLYREWTVEPSDWEPRHVEWVDETRLRLERAWPFTPSYRIDTVTVASVDGVWRIR